MSPGNICPPAFLIAQDIANQNEFPGRAFPAGRPPVAAVFVSGPGNA